MSNLQDQQSYILRLNNSNFTIANSKKIVAIVKLDNLNKIEMDQEISISISNNTVEEAFLPLNSIKIKSVVDNLSSKHTINSPQSLNATVKVNNFNNKIEDVNRIYVNNGATICSANLDAGEF